MARTRGASRLEMLIVAVLIGIVATLMLERMTRYQEYAEKAVMEATIAHMRSGLRVRIAELMIGGRMAQLADLQQENPITWLAVPPPNYGGPLIGSAKPVPGHWYYDRATRDLVYLPRHTRFFQPEEPGSAPEVRLQIRPANNEPPNPETGTKNGSAEGLRLMIANRYHWS